MQTFKNVPALYGTPRFSTIFTRAFHQFAPWVRAIQFIPLHSIPLRSTVILRIHLYLHLPNGLFLSDLTETLRAWHMTCHVNLLHLLCTLLQPLITSSPFSQNVLFRTLLIPLQSVLMFSWCQRTCFIPIQRKWQNYNSIYSNFYVFREQMRRKKILDWMIDSVSS